MKKCGKTTPNAQQVYHSLRGWSRIFCAIAQQSAVLAGNASASCWPLLLRQLLLQVSHLLAKFFDGLAHIGGLGWRALRRALCGLGPAGPHTEGVEHKLCPVGHAG